MTERGRYDFAVIGAGFAGSITAMMLRKLGASVAMIERGKHPRFAIGESSTPVANLLLERIAERFDLPELAPFSKWGTWRDSHPEIGCGLKRGFSFFAHRSGERFSTDLSHANQLLVAASPSDRIADTHWYRPDFDAWLAKAAVGRGVELIDQTEVVSAVDGALMKLTLRGCDGEREIEAGFVIDASGGGGCLGKLMKLPIDRASRMPTTFSVYGHFRGIGKLEGLSEFGGFAGAPYPPDDAAVHHLIDGGWIWVLRFANGITSAGAMLERGRWGRLAEKEPREIWQAVLKAHPSVESIFNGAEEVVPLRLQPSVSFRFAEAHGSNWALLPSATGFVDPMLSSGFALTLLGVWRLVESLQASGRAPADYSTRVIEELRFVDLTVAALYRSMPHFDLFTAVSKIYFSAASFSETQIRLGSVDLSSYKFLMNDSAGFGDSAKRALDKILEAPTIDRPLIEEMISTIGRIIQPIDIAGLGDGSRGSWFPASAEDLFANASKLGTDRPAIEAMLRKCGFEV